MSPPPLLTFYIGADITTIVNGCFADKFAKGCFTMVLGCFCCVCCFTSVSEALGSFSEGASEAKTKVVISEGFGSFSEASRKLLLSHFLEDLESNSC